jgi:PAS domain S-box-containing protein
MKNTTLGSVSKNLAFLVFLATMPALLLFFYNGMEQREVARQEIRRNLGIINNSMVEVHQDLAKSSRRIFSILSLLDEIRYHKTDKCNEIFAAVLKQNPDYLNLSLVGLNGDVLASAEPFAGVNLKDRKHFQEAIQKKEFVVGEFIVARIGETVPALPFASPVFVDDKVVAVLTMTISLKHLSHLFDFQNLPENSFIAVTDYKGIRLFYYPEKPDTNPIGKPINQDSWLKAKNGKNCNSFAGIGSDGLKRMFVYEKLRLSPEESPYAYVWCGIPQSFAARYANKALFRNVFFLFLTIFFVLVVAWYLGEKTLLTPIRSLAEKTRKFAAGELENDDDFPRHSAREFAELHNAFNDMAKALTQNQHKLAEERERLKVTLRSIGDGIITTDSEGKVVRINKVASALTGWEQSEACNRHVKEVCRLKLPEGAATFNVELAKILSNCEIVSVNKQAVLLTKSSEHKDVFFGGAPIKNQQEQICGAVVVLRDITQQLRFQAEIIKARKLESVGVLAGGIAHDFNNILTAIIGNIELAVIKLDKPQKAASLLKSSLKASLRAKELTQQFLTFARGGEPIKEASSLAEVVKDSADFMLRGRNIACNYTFPQDLWLVEVDKAQISQVVQNIILNACDAMPEGGNIDITAENLPIDQTKEYFLLNRRNHVKISIQDNGKGISEEIINKIFDPYFSTKETGNGLGLAISHSIIKKHGGYIAVQSSPEKGTTFTIFLPACPEQKVVSKIEEPLMQHQNAKSLKIMIMDDQEIVRETARVILESLDHQVTCVSGGREAIELYKKSMAAEQKFDLLIMDLTVPGDLGGQETIKEILKFDPNAKAIVTSGYSTDPVMANFKDYGFCAVIAKPFLVADFKDKIAQLFNSPSS